MVVEPAYITVASRLDSFGGTKTKSRRNSTRSKKSTAKTTVKGAWPLSAPEPWDLAFAGFFYKPTSTSPDNVQCFHCGTQLDGWEETDVPAFEHLTHFPKCAYAIHVCIRLRSVDPGRTDDDPMSETMVKARYETFADLWPLDVDAGFPSVDQLVLGGWYFDPSAEAPDGTTCAYCSLALDSWDAGDDPTEEHRKRAPDCAFFALQELYNSLEKPKATRGKRASARSSTASNKGTKTTRTKKVASKEDLNKPLPLPPDESVIESFADSVAVGESFANSVASVPAKPTKGRKTKKAAADEGPTEVLAESFAVGQSFSESVVSQPAKKGRKTKKAPISEGPTEVCPESYAIGEPFGSSVASQPAKKGRKPKKAPTPEPLAAPMSLADSFAETEAPTRPKAPPAKTRKTKATTKRASAVSVASVARSTRQIKRTSDAMDADDEAMMTTMPSPKRARISDISSNMILDESTPVRTPLAFAQLAAASPVKTPRPATPTQPQTPEYGSTPKMGSTWEPVNIDEFLEKRDVFGIVSNIIVDAGLDKENMGVEMKNSTEGLTKAVKAGLTSPEKKMSVEEWVMYNAQRGEEKLRMECERQIAAFECEGRRALAALDAY